jgi:hypothetical protein
MADQFNPVADYKRGMEANIEDWKTKIVSIRDNPVFGDKYKDFAIKQLENSIAIMEDAIVGFDNLTHPIKY